MRDRSLPLAMAIAFALYIVLIGPVALWPHGNLLFALTWVSLYALLASGLSLEVSELFLSLIWTPIRIPISQGQISRRKTAVLMTVCDDTDEHALSALLPLSKAGYAVFVLDDSSSPAMLPDDIRAIVSYRRRHIRTGAKAGNLNEWFARFGNAFENVVVLDADCTMSVEIVDELVRATLHPANADVAIFQSKVAPRVGGGSNLLSLLLGIGARPRARVLERVHARLGLVLSFGHNQLIRISALRIVGGFPEAFTSEDTALSLSFSALGLRTELVDVWSYDTEPNTVETYVRRTVRWARQTVELFRSDWTACPLRLKLLLCRHLLSYLLPIVGFVLLLISVTHGPSSVDEVIEFSIAALSFNEGYAFYGVAMWTTIVVLSLRLLLQFVLSLVEGAPVGPFVFSVFAGPSLQAILIFPVAWGMILSCLGVRVTFIPTNMRPAVAGDSKCLRQTIALWSAACGVGIALLVLTVAQPGSALVGFNFVWVLGFAASPLVLTILSAGGNRERGDSAAPGGTR